MRRLTITLLVVAAVFGVYSTRAHALVLQGAMTQPWQQWTNESQMPMANVNVAFGEGGPNIICGPVLNAAGCSTDTQTTNPNGTVTGTYQIALTTDDTPATLRHYLWHEETHVFDFAAMTDTYRAQFMAAWGLPGGVSAWWDPFPSGIGSPGEWFAEAGALCDRYGLNVGDAPITVTSDWTAYDFPGSSRMAAVEQSCRIIVAAGQTAGLAVPAQRTYPQAQAATGMARRGTHTFKRIDSVVRRSHRRTSGTFRGQG